METLIEIGIVIAIFYGFFKLLVWVWNNIGPYIMIAIRILAIVGLAFGTLGAFYCYGKSFIKNIDPYATYVDNSRNRQPARRSYFFGPGFHQLGQTIVGAWRNIGDIVSMLWDFMTDNGFWMGLASSIFVIPAIFTICVVGGAMTVVLSAIHAGVMLAVMLVIYVLFGVTWVIDWLYLYFHNIRAVCPTCKHRYRIPMFECPNCHRRHDKLVPGPYGIWHRRCVCGEKLPTTFLLGRSRLDAYCPHPGCHSPLASSKARQIGIQLVGGSYAGKTVLLASMYHNFRERLARRASVTLSVPDFAKNLFADLEKAYRGMQPDPTADFNAIMYPMLLDTRAADTQRQLSLYDVAGELFNSDSSAATVEAQFSFCDGLILVIDPFSSGSYRSRAEASQGAILDYSKALSETVVQNLAKMLQRIKHLRPGNKIETPVAVVITKADMFTVRGSVGYPKIHSVLRREPDKYASLAEARDALCRQFLVDIGLQEARDSIETCFMNVHYFPVSAIGHDQNGEEYEPWGVMEPLEWLLTLADPDFAEAIGMTSYEI